MDSLYGLLSLLFFVGLVCLYVIPTLWVYRDAKRRGRNQTHWLLISLAFGIFGWIAWLLFRPKRKVSNGTHQENQSPPQRSP
jgi:hypothetical protein